MEVNFKEALGLLNRALPMVLLRAGIIAAAGFMIIIVFGMLLFAFRPASNVNRSVAMAIAILVVLGIVAAGQVLRRFFLFRFRAAILLLFSGYAVPAPALATVMREAGRHFKNHSQWQSLNCWLRRTLFVPFGSNDQAAKISDLSHSGKSGKFAKLLTSGTLSQAVLVLAFSRGGSDIRQSAQEGAALYLGFGMESRRLANRWLRLSAFGFLILILCLALPNWFFFSSAGAPVWVGIVLAAIIAWILHQAFIVPFVLAGVSAALLTESKDQAPDRDLCEKLNSLIPAKPATAN